MAKFYPVFLSCEFLNLLALIAVDKLLQDRDHADNKVEIVHHFRLHRHYGEGIIKVDLGMHGDSGEGVCFPFHGRHGTSKAGQVIVLAVLVLFFCGVHEGFGEGVLDLGVAAVLSVKTTFDERGEAKNGALVLLLVVPSNKSHNALVRVEILPGDEVFETDIGVPGDDVSIGDIFVDLNLPKSVGVGGSEVDGLSLERSGPEMNILNQVLLVKDTLGSKIRVVLFVQKTNSISTL